MWTEKKDVEEYINKKLQDVTMGEIGQFVKKKQFSTTKEMIKVAFANKELIMSDFVLQNYDMLNGAFQKYCKKCEKFLHVLAGLFGAIDLSDELLRDMDITVDGSKVLTRDIDRIVSPLKSVYLKAVQLKQEFDNEEVFLKITVLLPKVKVYNPLINMSKKYEADGIAMTEKQKAEQYARHSELVKKIYEKHLEDQKKTCD